MKAKLAQTKGKLLWMRHRRTGIVGWEESREKGYTWLVTLDGDRHFIYTGELEVIDAPSPNDS